MSLSKKKEDEKEKKFLGRLSYKLDYDFDKNAVSAKCYLCQVLAKFYFTLLSYFHRIIFDSLRGEIKVQVSSSWSAILCS
ncbi:unnamed protein product [Heligmosomoides polygyrus]|uniref:Ovule protein n=1 Tax=Heligmosomoides polygyrus TaxID=6339 RepID=A0A183GXF3_HELPZ|nr:unnamed protein product [Heligmosomoides polygyrus]